MFGGIYPFRSDVSTGYASTKLNHGAAIEETAPKTDRPRNEQRTAKRTRVGEFPGLFFRKVQPCDRHQIQRLHELWFPVEYQEQFYDTLVNGKIHTPGHDRSSNNVNDFDQEGEVTRPLFTYVACVDPTIESVEAKEESADGCAVKLVSMEEARVECGLDDLDDYDYDCDYHDNSNEENRIAACIVGAKVEHDVLPLNLRQLLVPKPHLHSKLFYIMTLGTTQNYRSMGLASYLVLQCIEQQIENDQSCGTLYLHVLDTNYAAIRFYEKLGFYCVRLIPNYYTIDGRLRHCYLYAKYFHGNTGHLTLLDMLKRGFTTFLRTLFRQGSYDPSKR